MTHHIMTYLRINILYPNFVSNNTLTQNTLHVLLILLSIMVLQSMLDENLEI